MAGFFHQGAPVISLEHASEPKALEKETKAKMSCFCTRPKEEDMKKGKNLLLLIKSTKKKRAVNYTRNIDYMNIVQHCERRYPQHKVD